MNIKVTFYERADILSMLESGKSKSTYVSRNLKKKDVYSGNLNTKKMSTIIEA